MNKKLLPISKIFLLLAVMLPVGAYFLPLWQILMWAPQYPEGLGMKIWIDNLSGDVRTINALNHYIGMKNIEVSMFPEFMYMKWVVGSAIGIGLCMFLINRRWSLFGYLGVLTALGVAALYDFYVWGYHYGHNLNPDAPIKIPGLSYQPPLIGTKQLLNFLAFSGPDLGGWLFIASAGLLIAAIGFEIYKDKTSMAS